MNIFISYRRDDSILAAWLALFDALGIDPRVASATMLLAELDRDPQRAPSLYCSSTVKLDWQPVNGARDCVATLQLPAANSRTWQRVSSSATAATESLTGGSLNGSCEWTVQARNANASGPASTTTALDDSQAVSMPAERSKLGACESTLSPGRYRC